MVREEKALYDAYLGQYWNNGYAKPPKPKKVSTVRNRFNSQ